MGSAPAGIIAENTETKQVDLKKKRQTVAHENATKSLTKMI